MARVYFAEFVTMTDGTEYEYRFSTKAAAQADMKANLAVQPVEFTHESPTPLGAMRVRGLADVDAMPLTQTVAVKVPGVKSVRIEKVTE